MKTSRTDITLNKKVVVCKNSTFIGYSSSKLKYGDFFTCTDYPGQLCKCHGQVKPNDTDEWVILAQVASSDTQFTYERWIKPESVLKTLPAEKANQNIAAFFIESEEQ